MTYWNECFQCGPFPKIFTDLEDAVLTAIEHEELNEHLVVTEKGKPSDVYGDNV